MPTEPQIKRTVAFVDGQNLFHSARFAFGYITTQHPEPGMMRHEDIHLQLVDLPAVSPEHPVPWLVSALQTADTGRKRTRFVQVHRRQAEPQAHLKRTIRTSSMAAKGSPMTSTSCSTSSSPNWL